MGHHGDPVANTPVLPGFNVSWSQRGMFQTYLAVNETAISPTFCRLCGLLALDILDIRSDKPAGDHGDVYAEFNEAIHESTRRVVQEGWKRSTEMRFLTSSLWDIQSYGSNLCSGGQFERLIGLMTAVFHKIVGQRSVS